jgi:hypothetical protein
MRHLITFATVLALLAGARPAASQTATPAQRTGPEPFGIADNSFLVEEAFNQEAGIFQNIVNITRVADKWGFAFTQEWPVKSQTHQFSYTVTFLDGIDRFGAGDALIHYRYQALTEGPGRPAFSPRASLVLPTGNTTERRGEGSYGLQINLPFSKQFNDTYLHWNAGFTWLPAAERPDSTANGDDDEDLLSPFVSLSAIYRLRPMFHLMLEQVVLFGESLADVSGTTRDTAYTLSPGFRAGWNVGDKQIVGGFAVPVTWVDGSSDVGVFLYFSYELPFRK